MDEAAEKANPSERTSVDALTLEIGLFLDAGDYGQGLRLARELREREPASDRSLELHADARELSGLNSEALVAAGIEELMGVEGTAAREYFEGMRHKLKQDLGFRKRVRRPPTDPLNAMLSFGYTLLFGQVLSAVLAASLDPYQGTLHELKKDRPSLALDLMEEQRPVVDSLVVRSVNRIQVTAKDFAPPTEQGVRFTESGLAKFVKAYHERMAETVLHEESGRTVDYREYARLQAQSYKRWLRGEVEYRPLEWR